MDDNAVLLKPVGSFEFMIEDQDKFESTFSDGVSSCIFFTVITGCIGEGMTVHVTTKLGAFSYILAVVPN